jgi:putative DNA primase/helicase
MGRKFSLIVRDELLADLELRDEVWYDKRRKLVAKELRISPTELDRIIARRRAQGDDDPNDADDTDEKEAWPQQVKGDRLLEELCTVIKRHVILPPSRIRAIALWILFAHTHDAWQRSPILLISSPIKACGKTTVMELLTTLVPKPSTTSHATPAAIFRRIDHDRPTLLIDEADNWANVDRSTRAVLNSGHNRKFAFVTRAHERLSTWAPKAIALIGDLPPTLESRSIRIELEKKMANEQVRAVPHHANAYVDLHRRCRRWAEDNFEALKWIDPIFPKGLHNRDRDNWRPLLAIAERCGGEWPDKARNAAGRISKAKVDEDAVVLLLHDLKELFERKQGRNLSSTEIVSALARMEHRPWPEYHNGRPITGRGVAKLLKPFKIEPRQVPVQRRRPNGYEAAWFKGVFERYAPDKAKSSSASSAQ